MSHNVEKMLPGCLIDLILRGLIETNEKQTHTLKKNLTLYVKSKWENKSSIGVTDEDWHSYCTNL